jgi:hypothetical protein
LAARKVVEKRLLAHREHLADGHRDSCLAPKANAIVTFAKKVGTAKVPISSTFRPPRPSWRDVNGTRQAPPLTEALPVAVDEARTIAKIWVASPDFDGGAMHELPFTQADGRLHFTLPALKYWSMVVLEPEPADDRLLVVGDATSGGWDANNGIPLLPTDQDGVFRGTVYLEAGKPFSSSTAPTMAPVST